MRHSLPFIAALFIVFGMLQSCSPKLTGNFPQTDDTYVRLSEEYKESTVSQDEPIAEETTQWDGDVISVEKESIIEASAGNENKKVFLKEVIKTQKQKTEQMIKGLEHTDAEGNTITPTKKEIQKGMKKQVKRELEMAKAEGDPDYALMLILGILLAPLAIGITYGIGTEFWISLILFLLFWLPSAIYGVIKISQYYN